MSDKTHKTSRGVELTDDLIEELAKEAERGYDITELRRRRPGRPPLGSRPATVFQVRLDPELREALERCARTEETTPSEIARRALRAYLQDTSADRTVAGERTDTRPRGASHGG